MNEVSLKQWWSRAARAWTCPSHGHRWWDGVRGGRGACRNKFLLHWDLTVTLVREESLIKPCRSNWFHKCSESNKGCIYNPPLASASHKNKQTKNQPTKKLNKPPKQFLMPQCIFCPFFCNIPRFQYNILELTWTHAKQGSSEPSSQQGKWIPTDFQVHLAGWFWSLCYLHTTIGFPWDAIQYTGCRKFLNCRFQEAVERGFREVHYILKVLFWPSWDTHWFFFRATLKKR